MKKLIICSLLILSSAFVLTATAAPINQTQSVEFFHFHPGGLG